MDLMRIPSTTRRFEVGAKNSVMKEVGNGRWGT
jgi:hypothetical protein